MNRTLAYVLLAAALTAPVSCSKPAEANKAPPGARPVPVLAATAVRQTMPVQISTFGTVQADQSVSVRAQVTGILNKILVQNGQAVKQGQALYEIDPKPIEATIRQLEASKARDSAQLANANKELNRQTTLREGGVSAPAEVDKAQTDVDVLAATILADDANIESAKLQLGYCKISAPIAGRMGNLLVTQGNLVTANDRPLVVINQLQPIRVDFAVPQQKLAAVQKYMTEGTLKVLASVPNSGLPAEEGQLYFVDNAADPTTGMIKLSATFVNKDEWLWPGLYVDVVLTLSVQPDALVIPSPAVQAGRDGPYVFVIVAQDNGDKIAEARPVTVDRSATGVSIIASGLQSGEQVVTDGQVRLLPGAKVSIRTDIAGDPASRPAGRSATRPGRSGSDTRPKASSPAMQRS